jgi:hypothetical protein
MPPTLLAAIFPRETARGLLWLMYAEMKSHLRDKHEGIVD